MPEDAVDGEFVGALERVVSAAVAVTGRALAEEAPDLTFLQWRVLVVLAQSDGHAVSEIGRQIGSKLPATSRLVGRLRARGLIDSAKDTADARVTVVRLTDAGRALRRRVIARRAAFLATGARAANLRAADRGVLERLAAAIEGPVSAPTSKSA